MKKLIAHVLVFALILGLLAGCGQGGGGAASVRISSSVPEGSEATASSVPDDEGSVEGELDLSLGVALGRSAFIHENGVAFWCADETLCSALSTVIPIL